jgi:hypothetical protein
MKGVVRKLRHGGFWQGFGQGVCSFMMSYSKGEGVENVKNMTRGRKYQKYEVIK